MDLRIRYEKDIAIIDFKKEVDICSVNFIDLTEMLLRHGHTKILCNCINISGFDESGLYIVSMAFNNIRNKGGILKFCNVPRVDEKKFKAIHLDIIFEVGENERKAIKEFQTIGILDKLNQKRAYQRIDFYEKTELKADDGSKYIADILNLGPGGMFVVCGTVFPVGTKFKFTIFTSKEGPGESIDLSGEVNWVASTKKDIPGGMGIKFLHLD
ncbi:MAG: PilZ domain-containing protein, partial [Candidatus Omnitrophica bacterium]|nr:PilZ domain-containing protein [Candidatus Omnitrophota bacterium]